MAYKITSFFDIEADTDEQALEELKRVTEFVASTLADAGYENDLDNPESKPKSFVIVSYLGVDMKDWLEAEIDGSLFMVMPTKETE